MDRLGGQRFRLGSGSVDVGLICALQEECRHILRWGGWKRLKLRDGSVLYEKDEGRLRIRLVVSGIGGLRAASALTPLLDGFVPDLVICFGFAGALDDAVQVGDLVYGKKVAKWEQGHGLSAWRPLSDARPGPVPCHLGGFALREGSLVSVDGLTSKANILSVLGPVSGPVVMEMETYSLSLYLEPLGIPLAAIRSVSDEANLDAGPAVKAWMDDAFRIRPAMLAADVARHPLRINLVLKLLLRSRVASRSLSLGLRAVLEAIKGDI